MYAGQLDRIKSSVVYPVLSDKSELLGTVVIHCNRAGFFRTAEERFWTKLIEPYAKRIALEKIKFDYLVSVDVSAIAGAITPEALKPGD